MVVELSSTVVLNEKTAKVGVNNGVGLFVLKPKSFGGDGLFRYPDKRTFGPIITEQMNQANFWQS